jgi:response regulator NasT
MGSIIISLPKLEKAISLRDLIKSCGLWEDIIICHHGAEILNMVDNQDIGLIICVRKLRDMGDEELVNYLPRRVKVILLTRESQEVPFAENVSHLVMPFRKDELINAIQNVLPYKSKEKKKRFRTPEEQQMIDDAKAYIMEEMNMTEPDAFRYIQKISMDTRQSFVEVARKILEKNG